MNKTTTEPMSADLRATLVEIANYVMDPEPYKYSVRELIRSVREGKLLDAPMLGPDVSLGELVEIGDFFKHSELLGMFHRSMAMMVFNTLVEELIGEEGLGFVSIVYGKEFLQIAAHTFEPMIPTIDNAAIFDPIATGHYDEDKATALVDKIVKCIREAKEALTSLELEAKPTLH